MPLAPPLPIPTTALPFTTNCNELHHTSTISPVPGSTRSRPNTPFCGTCGYPNNHALKALGLAGGYCPVSAIRPRAVIARRASAPRIRSAMSSVSGSPGPTCTRHGNHHRHAHTQGTIHAAVIMARTCTRLRIPHRPSTHAYALVCLEISSRRPDSMRWSRYSTMPGILPSGVRLVNGLRHPPDRGTLPRRPAFVAGPCGTCRGLRHRVWGGGSLAPSTGFVAGSTAGADAGDGRASRRFMS